MDVERPRRRRRRAHNEEDVGGYQGPDRISHLPDEVAHHILSFLPMEDVAQTSTLSKRWKFIWRTLPVVDFDENRFQHLDDLQCRQEFLYSMSRLLLSEDLNRALIKKLRVISIHPRDAGLELLINLFIDLSLSKRVPPNMADLASDRTQEMGRHMTASCTTWSRWRSQASQATLMAWN
ncbi:hypothetical protein TIFTF001_043141 [Ficus carica]|uniref:F-box domain-containing protein n=1 Tax=Ficus carica TaxID=3494 RepID=A0AA87Z2F7_FICCA|nr:hypothetical protein TIFTF001_043141 [Ficus carica]